jgi:2-phosphosulfolactate phosphatase
MSQSKRVVTCEWGAAGVERMREETDVFIIVDVLSFTTCVDVAVARGALVYPYRWKDFSSAEYAEKVHGALAVSSKKPGYSLSPASLVTIEPGTRLVLPSPNGSTLSLATGGKPTLAGCLRNASAVGLAACELGERICVIAGGEHWPDGSLRAAVEDWLGAGAILASLREGLSPEAELASLTFQQARYRMGWYLEGCTSGQELIQRNRAGDILLAGEWDVSECVPILHDGYYSDLKDWGK